ncbi:hypothetical protein BSKO_04070 [Bryopsis sp. KO-2023]|nr:hypothetical protein BSKO_04070 [Bryopsis sp. KO-2023]
MPNKPKTKRRKSVKPSWNRKVVVPPSYDSTKHDPARYGTVHEPAFNGHPARHFQPNVGSYQRVACSCLERKESLIFGARSSAARYLVEEYTLAMACRDVQKVVFVCADPRLSSRKYKLLKSSCPAGSSVGLLTEETSVDLGNATSIVTTVHTLRRLSYKKAAVLRDVAWLVFDEVLCLGWEESSSWSILEESLLVLDKSVRCLFLTYPLPNMFEFAEWLVSLLDQPCHMIETDHRPAPLKHFGYPMGGDGLFLLKDEVGGFKEDRFGQMVTQVKANARAEELIGFGGVGRNDVESTAFVDKDGKDLHSHVAEILFVFESNKFLPCAVCFASSKLCEQSAMILAEKYDFNSQPHEKLQVGNLFNRAIQCLDEGDRNLAALHNILPFLRKGIGTYHSGMLPVIKEIMELMIEENFIKVLCATEDYSVVPRLPMRSVVLTSIFKFDGKSRRLLSSSEYIRMSSLAGRTQDSRGFVICMISEHIDCSDCENLMMGGLEPVSGALSPTDYTTLNLLRKPGVTPSTLSNIFTKSLADFQHRKRALELQAQARKLMVQLGGAVGEREVRTLLDYKDLVERMAGLKEMTWSRALQPENSLAFLRPGRLVRVPRGWGVLLSVVRRYDVMFDSENPYLAHVLFKGAYESSSNAMCCIETKSVPVANISGISSLLLTLPEDLGPLKAQMQVVKMLKNLELTYPDGFPQLDIVQDMGLVDSQVISALTEMEKLCMEIHAHPVHEKLKDQSQACYMLTKAEKLIEAEGLKKEAADIPATKLSERVDVHLGVLRALKYINEEGELLKKGVAACEVESVDCLLCVEALTAGVFDGLDKHCLAAVACDFLGVDPNAEVLRGSINREAPISSALNKVRQVAENITDVKSAHGQFVDRMNYLGRFESNFVDLMFAWSKGASFREMCNMTRASEGDVVNLGRRLLRLLQELVSCARILGFEKIATSLEDCIQNFAHGMMVALPLSLNPETMVLDP